RLVQGLFWHRVTGRRVDLGRSVTGPGIELVDEGITVEVDAGGVLFILFLGEHLVVVVGGCVVSRRLCWGSFSTAGSTAAFTAGHRADLGGLEGRFFLGDALHGV